MGIARLVAAGLVGYGLYRWAKPAAPAASRVAFAPGQANHEGISQIRDAGPAAMASDPPHWDRVDQLSDESFPASDAPGTY